jgi:hypothetical protein
MQGHRVEAEIQLQNIRNLGAGRDVFSAPRPDIFNPSPEKDPAPIVQESEWASGPAGVDVRRIFPLHVGSISQPSSPE